MKALLIGLLVVLFVRCEFDLEFAEFQTTYNKYYPTRKEQDKRYKIFVENMKMISQHNMNPDKTFEMGITPFTDMTYMEIQHTMLMPERVSEPFENVMGDTWSPIDWRNKGAVTAVKDQNPCGSCYSFGAIGASEGFCKVKTGTLMELSNQQCVDCGGAFGNDGCQGGMPEWCMRYYVSCGGIMSDRDYPYIKRAQACKFNKAKVMAKTGNPSIVKGESSIQNIIQSHPTSILMHCTNKFSNYKGGVFVDETCSNRTYNHAMTLIGLGTVSGTNVYIIKNSWGTGWGDRGYLYMPANKNNYCNIGAAAAYPASCSKA